MANVKNTEATEQVAQESKEQFINENISFVPSNRKNKFRNMDIDEQVAAIKKWKASKERHQQWLEDHKMENMVKDLFTRRKATTEDALKVIDYCKSYIAESKAEEMKKIQAEIDRLTAIKDSINKEVGA